MKKIRQDLKRRIPIIKFASLALTLTIFSGEIEICKEFLTGVEKITLVTAEERKSIYNDNDIEKKGINFANEDYNITLENLKKVSTLKIDMSKVEDLSFLKKYPNLRNLTLTNIGSISDEDLIYINESSIENLIIKGLIYSKDKIKMSCLCKNVIVDCDTELEGVLFLDSIDELPVNCYSKNIEQYKELNKKIDLIINDLDLDNLNDMDKLIKISEFITNKIEYDSIIKENLSTGVFTRSGRGLTKYYNECPLSSILDNPNKEVSGVCENYACLMTVLCRKAGLDVYYVNGKNKNSNYGHAWNYVNLEGEKTYVDITNLDSNEIFEDMLKKYNASNGEIKDEYSEKLKDVMFREIKEFNEIYSPYINLKTLEDKNVSYFNVKKDGTLAFDGKLWYVVPLIVGVGNGFIFFNLCIPVFTLTNKLKRLERE